MTKQLRNSGLGNAIALSVIMLSLTVQNFLAGNVVMGLLGAIATGLAAADAIKFYDLKVN